ncbi:Protein CBG26727 [Caenorhabditis briggsae]|uniref:Protein CBG26727 n=1 Tax=Caenorhabditis briggsae TaxID=6238 RepID=B6IEA2_CAEBR|nr:Protein CBG26727 [Caenorhabditis briggsae]CAS01166.1 Protein CBG26727 [Caenorhabditis briggsae]
MSTKYVYKVYNFPMVCGISGNSVHIFTYGRGPFDLPPPPFLMAPPPLVIKSRKNSVWTNTRQR